MSSLIKIKPSTGEDSATLFSGDDATSPPLGKIKAGTIFRKESESGTFFKVKFDNDKTDIASGGESKNCTIMASPYTSLYKTEKMMEWIGNVNNGNVGIILDDSNPKIYKISVPTTNGTLEGYIQTRYVYRDELSDEEKLARKTRSLTNTRSISSTGTITAKTGLNCYITVGEERVGAIAYNTKVQVLDSNSGYLKVTAPSGAGWGTLTNVWVSASYVALDNTNTTASVSKSDATELPNSTQTSSTTSDPSSNITTEPRDNTGPVIYVAPEGLNNNEYYTKLSNKYMNVLGAPFKYNVDIDPQYLNSASVTEFNANGYGRVMSKTMMSSPSILSILPGKASMFPDLLGTEPGMKEKVEGLLNGIPDVLNKVTADSAGAFSSKMYKFEADTENYAKSVNGICRTMAVMMGIANMKVPDTTATYGTFDYTYWTIRKKYNPGAAASQDPTASIFRDPFMDLFTSPARIADVAVNATAYMNFFLSGSGGNLSENMRNDVTDSPLDSILNAGADLGAKLNYFTGSGFDLSGTDASEMLKGMFGGDDSLGAGLLTLGENILKGGRMVLPKMMAGAEYGKSYSAEMKFNSLYGNKEAIFLNCVVPTAHLLPCIVPKQLSDNMYTFPYVLRANQTGKFNSDACVMTNLDIQRDNFTVDGLATEWTVTLELTPLIDNLMISPSSNPLLLIQNDTLLDYMANLSGFDLLTNNLDMKLELMKNLALGMALDVPRSLEHKVSDAAYNAINKIFRL